MAVPSRRFLVVVALIVAVAAAAFLIINPFSSAATVVTGDKAAHGATVLRYDIRSRYVDQSMPQVGAVPAGKSRRRPLLVFLHGRGGELQESNANDAFFKALAALGSSAPAVVFPGGADHSYWHKRSSGDWPRYVLNEVIPAAVRRLHADPRRVAIGGISMGGYGAYEIAALRPSRFCAVGGHSAAIWTTAGESAPGAFDESFLNRAILDSATRTMTAMRDGRILCLGDSVEHDILGGQRAGHATALVMSGLHHGAGADALARLFDAAGAAPDHIIDRFDITGA